VVAWTLAAGCGRTGVQGTASTVLAQPASLDFGQVTLSSTARLSVTLSATGLTSVELLVDAPNGGPLAWSGASFSLGPNGAVEVPVYFSPTALGPAHAVLSVRSSRTGEPVLAVPVAGSGAPFGCDPQTPDGTPCQLWWAPCAVGPACRGGVCHSASAEAEMPGNLRWSFAMPGITALVSDEIGDSYSLVASGGVIALDACGNALWANTTSYDSLLLWGETLVASTSAGRLDALSRLDGSLLWSADVAALLGCNSGACGQLIVSQPVLTNQGQLLVFATDLNAGVVPISLLSFGPDGGLQFTTSYGPEPKGYFIESAVADLAGNTYLATTLNGVPDSILSFDSSGGQRPSFTAPSADPGRLAVNGTLLIGAGTEWSLQGMGMSEIESPEGLGRGLCGDPGAADAVGTLYCFTSRETPDTVMAIPPAGSLLLTPLPAFMQAVSNLVLGDSGELFVVADVLSSASGSSTLLALEPTSGAIVWSVHPFQAPTRPGSALTLSASATLLVSDPQGLYGVFAGQVRPPASAFWSRFGGSPENRNAPSPDAGD
jgi:outer membrane protein assembly factor BamB